MNALQKDMYCLLQWLQQDVSMVGMMSAYFKLCFLIGICEDPDRNNTFYSVGVSTARYCTVGVSVRSTCTADGWNPTPPTCPKFGSFIFKVHYFSTILIKWCSNVSLS